MYCNGSIFNETDFSTLQTHPCNENRVFLVRKFLQGKHVFITGIPAMRTGFPVMKTGFSLFHYMDGLQCR